MSSEHVCAWCAAERGEAARAGDSHGICERHAAAMKREAMGFVALDLKRPVALDNLECERVERQGKRASQLAFSAAVLLGCILVGALIGATAAILEVWARSDRGDRSEGVAVECVHAWNQW